MIKFLKYLFVLIFLLCIAVVGTGFYFYKTFNPNDYKEKIEIIASKALNRKVSIKGNIGLALSLVPTIEINDVTIGNPDWAVSPYFLKIKEADLTFKIMPLFDKKIEIDDINVIEPDIHLEESAGGEQNWVFSQENDDIIAKKDEIKQEIEDEIKSTPAGLILGGIMLGDVLVKNGKINYYDAKTKKKETLVINEIFSDYIDEYSNLNLRADIVYDKYRVNVKFETASVDKFMNDPKNLPIKTDISVNKASLVFNGTISELSEKAVIIGKINAYNPAGSFNVPETTLEAQIKASMKEINADISTLNIATNLIAGKIKANINKKVPYINATLKSKLINLESLNKNTSVLLFFPEIIKTANAAPEQKNILAEKVDYSLLKLINADIDAEVEKLVVNKNFVVDGLKTKIKVNNGVLTLNPLNMIFAEGSIVADAVINADSQSVIANINTKNLILQEVLDVLKYTDGTNFSIASGGNTDIKANLKTQGKTYGDLLKNLSGNLIIILDKSKVQTGKFEFIQSNIISQILQTLQVYAPKTGKTTLNCAVIRADIKNGVASFPKGIAIDTKNLTLISSGTINLDNQKIDFSLKPSSKNISATNISQALSSLIKIRGTLDDPKIGIDDAGAIKTIVGVVTTGPVMLGSQVLLDGDDYPCYTALKGTSEEKRFPAPKGVSAATKKAYSTTSDSIDNTVKGVMSAAGELAGDLLNSLSGNRKENKKMKNNEE